MEDKKKVVLVVEDDKFISSVHKNRLTQDGFEVIMAENGQEGISQAKKQKPDIILLDLIMPVMNGFDALKALKADDQLKDIKVVILSNLNQEEDRKRVMDMGAVDYIVKANVSFKEIIGAVKHHLGME
jgi:twitching motility two-component system response regulator PilH